MYWYYSENFTCTNLFKDCGSLIKVLLLGLLYR